MEVNRFLCAGTKFSVPITYQQIPLPTIIIDLKYCISNQHMSDNDKNYLRTQTINILRNYYNLIYNTKHSKEIIIDFFKRLGS